MSCSLLLQSFKSFAPETRIGLVEERCCHNRTKTKGRHASGFSGFVNIAMNAIELCCPAKDIALINIEILPGSRPEMF
jgi:hypothetical protein